MPTDPRALIDHAPMSRAQWTAVAIMVGLNGLDGFDVLSISFTSPGMTENASMSPARIPAIVITAESTGLTLRDTMLCTAVMM